jgi:hypothetical protein
MFSGVVATSLHTRDNDLELWLVHLASLIGCMSSTGVSDPVNVHKKGKKNQTGSQMTYNFGMKTTWRLH